MQYFALFHVPPNIRPKTINRTAIILFVNFLLLLILSPHQIPISQFQKLEVDYQLIIKNIIPKIANPSQIATILKFFELIFPFLYSSWHK